MKKSLEFLIAAALHGILLAYEKPAPSLIKGLKLDL